MRIDPSYIAVVLSVVALSVSIYAARQAKRSAIEAKRANDTGDAKRRSDALSLASEKANQVLSVGSKIGAYGADLINAHNSSSVFAGQLGSSRHKLLVEKTQKTIDDAVLMVLPAKIFLDDFARYSLSSLVDIEQAKINFNATRILLEGVHDQLAGELDEARRDVAAFVATRRKRS